MKKVINLDKSDNLFCNSIFAIFSKSNQTLSLDENIDFVFNKGWHDSEMVQRWSERQSTIKTIKGSKKIEFDVFGIPNRIEEQKNQKLQVFVDGILNKEIDLRGPCKISLILNGEHRITLKSNMEFVPKNIGINMDCRGLSFYIKNMKYQLTI